MKAFWSRIARELSPYVPGEQPRIANLVKLNTNESPFGPSPLALEAMRAAAVDTLRLYPDPEAQERREAGSIVIANPNAPTGVALPRAEIARLLEDHPDIPVVIDEAYVYFGGESAVPLIADHPNLLVVQTMSKSRALAGLRVGYALGDVGLIAALRRVKDSFNSYPLGSIAQAGATASVRDDAYFRENCARV